MLKGTVSVCNRPPHYLQEWRGGMGPSLAAVSTSRREPTNDTPLGLVPA